MTLHEDKFEYICHSSKKTNYLRHLPFVSEFYQYKTSMDILSPVQQLKDLGILVSQDLSWSTHIRSTCDKARQKACWVLSVFFTRSPTVMLNLYKSMVRSLLEYCSPLLYGVLQKSLTSKNWKVSREHSPPELLAAMTLITGNV